jgi:hypothetical protein
VSQRYLKDATGTHALEHVIAITPLHHKSPDGTIQRSRAVLHAAGGQFFHTDTDYEAALKAWGFEDESKPERKATDHG